MKATETSPILRNDGTVSRGRIDEVPSPAPNLSNPRNQALIANQFLSAINDRRDPLQQKTALIVLLVVITLERFAFYGIVCNYVLYLNKYPLKWESYNASTMLLVFFGISYMTSVLGGWIADSLLGKYITICISFVMYIIGYAAFPLLSWHRHSLPEFCVASVPSNNLTIATEPSAFMRSIIQESCSTVVILSAILTGIAVGFTNANLGTFGADQVISRGQSMVFKYFNWLYWCTNFGSLVSFSTLAFVQQDNSFFVGFLVPFIALILSFVLFLCGKFIRLSTCLLKYYGNFNKNQF